jgi:hypothetical protein
MHDHHLRGVDEHRDGREALDRVVIEALVDRGGGDERARRAEQQGVAVGLRRRDRFGSDRAAGAARAIFNDEGLAEGGGQTIGDEADDELGRPARRKRHDDLDRTIGIAVGRGRRKGKRAEVYDDDGQASHDKSFAARGERSHGRFLLTFRDGSSAV